MDSVLKLSEIATWGLPKVVAEIFFIGIGIVFILTGLKALKDKGFDNAGFSAVFWFIVAFTFIAGPYVPKFITGICVILMALLTAIGKVGQSASDVPTAQETRKNADIFGNKVFIAPLVLAISAWVIATVWKDLGANNAVGLSSIYRSYSYICSNKGKAGICSKGRYKTYGQCGLCKPASTDSCSPWSIIYRRRCG